MHNIENIPEAENIGKKCKSDIPTEEISFVPNSPISFIKQVDNVFLSSITKKIIEEIIEKLNTNLLKIQKNFFLEFIPTEYNLFINKYIKKLGNLLFINNLTCFIECEKSYIQINLGNNQTILDCFISVYSNSQNECEVKCKEIELHFKEICKDSSIPQMSIVWFSKVNNREVSYQTTEYLNDIFYKEAYPYINDYEKYIDDYIKSLSPVLILIGPPGTGKTRFIRQILKKLALNNDINKCKTLFTSSKDVIEDGNIYLSLIFEAYECLVLEDIDYHMSSRKEGNTSLYNLLSVSNGLLANCMGNKKIILSTNLPHTSSIDDALLRPGRCFDILKTRKLTKDESLVLYKLLGKNPGNDDKYSIAEIYNS